MQNTAPLASYVLSLAAVCSAAGIVVSVGLWRRLSAAQRMCEAARDGEASVTRSLRLFAQELQGLVLSLRGQADRLVCEAHPAGHAVAAAATQLGALADELGHHLTPASLQRALDCETVSLDALVAEAVASLSAILSPGQRTWRVSGPPVLLWADRRGLRQVLARLLGEAIRSSGQNDWIEITWQIEADHLILTVEDEGAGTATPGSIGANDERPGPDSRGIGLRLALARMLIEAHDGTMEVEALPRIGTRVTVWLPASRLRHTTEPALADATA